jgi:hypothetical protein
MNIKLYNESLDKALAQFTPVPAEEESHFLVQYEADSTKFALSLLQHNILKMEADEINLHFLHTEVLRALKVLYIAVRRSVTVTSQLQNVIDKVVMDKFLATVSAMRTVAETKNNDYSPFNIFKMGNLGLATRIGDKVSRITNALVAGTQLKVKYESVIDTALDLVNYNVFHVMVCLDAWVTPEERSHWQTYLSQNGAPDAAQVYAFVGNNPITVR